jgi:hypothetical protein
MGGVLGLDPVLIEKEAEKTKRKKNALVRLKNRVIDHYLGIPFLNGSDCTRHDYLQGNNTYPKTLTSTYHILNDWKAEFNSNDNA